MSALAGLGRLQNTMALLALLAASEASGFSSLEASLIAGALFFAAAFSALSKGRIVDLRGRRIVRSQAILLALLFLFLGGAFLWAPWWLVMIFSGALGLVRINPAALQQALWTDLHKERISLYRALAWENALSSLAQTAGPLLAAGAIWIFGGYGALLLMALVVPVAMFFWGALAPAEGRSSQPGSPLGLLLLPIAITLFLLALSNGLLQGLLLRQEGGPLLLAVYTLGAAALGVFFFRRTFPRRISRWIIILGPLALLALFAEGSFEIPALFIAGVLFASGVLAINIQISGMAPSGKSNESFSLPLLVAPLGMSAGILLSGLFLERGYPLEYLLWVSFAIMGLLFVSRPGINWRRYGQEPR